MDIRSTFLDWFEMSRQLNLYGKSRYSPCHRLQWWEATLEAFYCCKARNQFSQDYNLILTRVSTLLHRYLEVKELFKY